MNYRLIESFEKGLKFLLAYDKQTWVDQGHNATGKTLQSFEYRLVIGKDSLVGIFYADEAAIYQNYGVAANRFNIGWSKWQEVTKGWVNAVFASKTKQERKQIQYFVWRKLKTDGMPAANSRRLSKTGERTKWIDAGTTKWLEVSDTKLFSIGNQASELFEQSLDLIKAAA